MDQQIITYECRNCSKVMENSDGLPLCTVYNDPAAVQHRMGRNDACGINFVAVLVKGEKVRVGQQKGSAWPKR